MTACTNTGYPVNPRPDWLTESCPNWCIADHTTQTHIADRTHISPGFTIPGIAQQAHSTTDRAIFPASDGVLTLSSGEHVVGITLEIVLHRQVGSPLTWVYIGDGRPDGLELSTDTAWLLVEAFQSTLQR